MLVYMTFARVYIYNVYPFPAVLVSLQKYALKHICQSVSYEKVHAYA